MDDGAIPAALEVLPLRRISPSRFTAIKDCALREVWAAARNPGVLPKSAAAHMGTIIHVLFEKAAKCELAGLDKQGVESIWSELETTLESDLLKSWIERVNVPLRHHVYRYSVRKLRAIQGSLSLATEVGAPTSSGVGRGRGTNGPEAWLETPDGTVGGLIDRIIWDGSSVILRDYKSGHVFDGQDGQVREEYRTQLKLYAALFQSCRHQWPDRLEVAPPAGPPVEIKFAVEECEALLQEATHVLNEVNDAVSVGTLDALAAPSPNTCRFCSFRPCCSSYREMRESGVSADSDWPLDVWGEFVCSEIMGDGLMLITLIAESHRSEEISVKRLTPQGSRHPALTRLSQGQRVGVFNLRRSRRTGEYCEGFATTIYDEEG